jgi:hypothetical protein
VATEPIVAVWALENNQSCLTNLSNPVEYDVSGFRNAAHPGNVISRPHSRMQKLMVGGGAPKSPCETCPNHKPCTKVGHAATYLCRNDIHLYLAAALSRPLSFSWASCSMAPRSTTPTPRTCARR